MIKNWHLTLDLGLKKTYHLEIYYLEWILSFSWSLEFEVSKASGQIIREFLRQLYKMLSYYPRS